MTTTDTTIYFTAVQMGIPPQVAQIMIAQARHETADYTSNAFKLNNNICGYKYVSGAKWQTGAGITSSESNAYAKYARIEDSVGELVDWLHRREKEGKLIIANLTTTAAYATALKACGFYGDTISNYAAGLAAKFAKIDWGTVATAGGISLSLVAIAIGIFFLLKSKQ